MTSPPPVRSNFRPDIEGMRGVAILLVVAYHAGVVSMSGGFVGVDVFFILSGYLITGLLVREIGRTGRVGFAEFYARRVRRLLPAAAVVIVATVLAGRLLLSPLEEKDLAKTALATALYVSNLFFARTSTNYLAGDVHANPLLHTWSLAVEEQFYLVWPLLMLLLARVFGVARRGRLMVVMAGLAVLSLLACVLMTHRAQPWAFFTTPFRAWEFALGGIAGLASTPWLRNHLRAVMAGAWIGAAAILAAAMLFGPNTSFPGVAALLPAGGTALVLLAGAAAPLARLPRALSNRVLLYLGRVSYSWYLWHWPVLVFVRTLAPHSGHVLVAAGVAGSLALAALTNVLIENPARYSAWLRPRPALSLGLAGALTMVSVGCSGLGFLTASRAANSPAQRAFTQARDDMPSIFGTRCLSGAADVSVHVDFCTFGDSAGTMDVVLFGDSHAAQWFPALDRIAQEHHWRLLVVTKAKCPAASVRIYYDRLGRDFTECDQWRAAALDTIVALHPDAVVASSSTSYLIALEPVTPAEWGAGLTTTLGTLDAAGIPTFLLRDSPQPGFDIPTCASRAAWRGEDVMQVCRVVRAHAFVTAAFPLAQEAASRFRRVSTIDLSDEICGPEVCPPVRNGVVVYRDVNHLTASYVRTLAPALEARLASIPDGDARGPR